MRKVLQCKSQTRTIGKYFLCFLFVHTLFTSCNILQNPDKKDRPIIYQSISFYDETHRGEQFPTLRDSSILGNAVIDSIPANHTCAENIKYEIIPANGSSFGHGIMELTNFKDWLTEIQEKAFYNGSETEKFINGIKSDDSEFMVLYTRLSATGNRYSLYPFYLQSKYLEMHKNDSLSFLKTCGQHFVQKAIDGFVILFMAIFEYPNNINDDVFEGYLRQYRGYVQENDKLSSRDIDDMSRFFIKNRVKLTTWHMSTLPLEKFAGSYEEFNASIYSNLNENKLTMIDENNFKIMEQTFWKYHIGNL